VSTVSEAAQEPKKTQLFKSRKELVALAIAATIFAFVIYKMYLSKGGQEAPVVAELADGAAVVAQETPTPAAAAAAPRLLALIDPAELDRERGTRTAPPKLSRNPFAMSKRMRDGIYKPHPNGANPTGKSKPVTLTADNLAETLARIPGAEKAARKGLKLDAVLTSGGWKGAVVNGKVIQVGHVILGFTLTEVAEDGIILQRGEHRVRLLMRPPTPPDED